MYLIVGLGNPGRKYENTRHNAGFEAVDLLAKKLGTNIEKVKFKGIYQEVRYKNEKIFLLKPETYMNASGDSIIELMNYYSIPIENLIVLVDDIDIKFGTVRIKKNGSAGTHNGLKSIIKNLNSKEFIRVKIAVGKKPEYMDLADYVLSKFSNEQRKTFDKELELATEAIFDILDKGVDFAMNKINPKIVE